MANVLHTIDLLHIGGIADLILTLFKHSVHDHMVSVWSHDGGLEPEMIKAGMRVFTNWDNVPDNIDAVVSHTSGAWWSDGIFYEAKRRGAGTIEHLSSNVPTRTMPELIDLMALPNRTVAESLNTHIKQRVVLRDPIDLDAFLPNRPATREFWGRSSRIAPEKGIAFSMAIARALPAERFLIAGGPVTQELIVSTPPNVLLSGWSRDLAYDYSRMHTFVFPTYDESYCRSIAQAMADGLPIICMDTPVLRETTGGQALYANGIREFVDYIHAMKTWSARNRYDMGEELRAYVQPYGLEPAVGAWDEAIDYVRK